MISVHDIAGVALREMREIFADRWTSAALFVVPLAAGLLLTLIYREQVVRAIPTEVVDLDGTALSLAFRRALASSESLDVVPAGSGSGDIEHDMRSGLVRCVVEIPPGFASEVKRGKSAPVLCTVNGTNIVVTNYALRAVQTVAATFAGGIGIQKLEKKSSGAVRAMQQYAPVTLSTRLLYNPGQNYADFFVPGILAALLQQVVVAGAALTWAREFQTGRIRQLLAGHRSLASVIAGKTLVYVAVGWAWGVVFFAGLFALAGVPFRGSAAAGAVALTLMLAGMAMVAMLVSSMVSKPENAMPIVFIISSPAFLLSGYTFPQMAMVPLVRCAGELIPLTPFLIAWRRIVLYGAGTGDILPQILAMSVQALLLLAVMALIVRRRLTRMAPVAEGTGP
ncbi:MAG TPA: ABC transporter permease [Bacteroidota bacterium]|nr:ABC transporter permease [Bacteroidota bacterium]